MTPLSTSASESPGESVQGARKRETLISRAKRIIGRELDSPEDSGGKHGQKRGPPKKSPTRRREQVLQAQRTHRQRTQGYIKELEKEVLSFKKENSDLKRMVSLLQETLLENNISLPEGFQSPEGFASPPDLKMSPSPAVQVNLTSLAEVKAQKVSSSEAPAYQTPTSIAMDLDSNFGSATDPYGIEDNPFVTVDLTGLASTPSHKWCSTKAVTGGVPVFEPPDNTYRDPFGQEDEHVEKPAPTLTCQAAMDFVLELEKPCFPHVRYQYFENHVPETGVPEYSDGPGHVFMATTALVNSQLPFNNPAAAPFELSVADIGQLFQSSLLIDFGTDVTPVQIWANIVRISAARNGIHQTFLRALTDELMRYVRCNSFGAVVEKDTADLVLGFFFPGERFVDSWN